MIRLTTSLAKVYAFNHYRLTTFRKALTRNDPEDMNTQTQNFLAGVRAEIPLLISGFPEGMIYGALALNAGLSNAAALMMSTILYAGSAQFITAQLVH